MKARHQQLQPSGDADHRAHRRAGKFDLFFISDGLAMDPGDHPSFVNRFEPLASYQH